MSIEKLRAASAILSNVISEFPKHPTQCRLIELIDPKAPDRMGEDNVCLCLLGQVAISGGISFDALISGFSEYDYQPLVSYRPLEESGAIQEAVYLLGEAINGIRQTDFYIAKQVVYDFNDTTLQGRVGSISEHSVELVVEKVHQAWQLCQRRIDTEIVKGAVEILETILSEFPKRPATGKLVMARRDLLNGHQIFDGSECLCLLGHVGLAAGKTVEYLAHTNAYDALFTDNPVVEMAVRFLARASPEDYVTGTYVREVYAFNDATLVFVDENEAPDAPVLRYTEESVGEVTEVIAEALRLAKCELELRTA